MAGTLAVGHSIDDSRQAVARKLKSMNGTSTSAVIPLESQRRIKWRPRRKSPPRLRRR
jgi:hypothetical protein